MPLKKLTLKAGINKENTRYTNENGWYDCDKIRFRQGTPEKIGGWARISVDTFLGVCRSLWNWTTLAFNNYMGVGTHLKFYIESSGSYYDITPLRATDTLGANPFATVDTSTTITVTDATLGYIPGDFVTFSGATAVGGITVSGQYQIVTTLASTYTITSLIAATSSAIGGGASVSAAYQINVGPEISVPNIGWGAGSWGSGTWGLSASTAEGLRIWNQINFGEDLIFGPKGSALYYWTASIGLTARGVLLSSLAGASDVPLYQNRLVVSDASRFVLVFGTNAIGSAVLDPMLLRWSDQENATAWTPSALSFAGSLRLSRGSKIVAAIQSRQEILVLTDAAVYSLQYLGAPFVWSSQLLGDNISIVGANAISVASSVVYWMGIDKFYKYDGRVQTLRCDLRQYIYEDINQSQTDQFFSSTSEGFNEVWWFYCSANSTVIDRYVVYNYLEDIWYPGTMGRTAWLDSGLRANPQAATYVHNLVNHEYGVDDYSTSTAVAISASVTSSEFDLDDGYNFMFVWRMLPDVTFRGSTTASPQITMTLSPMQNSGSGYNTPASLGGTNNALVTQTSRDTTYQVEQFTGYIYTRVRGRQLAMKIECSQIGATFQLGSPRIDMRPDGRR
jgi:hypothetical protein